MSRVRVSLQAEADLAEIWLHIARQSAEAADRLVAEIARNNQTLANFPGLGERCDTLLPGLRASRVGNYVTYYRPVEDGIEVLRVIHGARDVGRQFDPPLN